MAIVQCPGFCWFIWFQVAIEPLNCTLVLKIISRIERATSKKPGEDEAMGLLITMSSSYRFSNHQKDRDNWVGCGCRKEKLWDQDATLLPGSLASGDGDEYVEKLSLHALSNSGHGFMWTISEEFS